MASTGASATAAASIAEAVGEHPRRRRQGLLLSVAARFRRRWM